MRWPSTRIICSWLWEQYWLARRPGFLAATLAELRSIIGPEGQREVLLAELSSLTIPTLIIWGAEDAIFPLAQAEAAVMHLRHSQLNVSRPAATSRISSVMSDSHRCYWDPWIARSIEFGRALPGKTYWLTVIFTGFSMRFFPDRARPYQM